MSDIAHSLLMTQLQFRPVNRDGYLDINIIKDEGVISVGADTQPLWELTLILRANSEL